MKHRVTMLHLLDEGDKFQFANEDGTLKSERMYFVEGQYQKFGCTTVIAEHNIKECPHYGLYADEGQHTDVITRVENIQWVHLVQSHAIHVCHKVKTLRK